MIVQKNWRITLTFKNWYMMLTFKKLTYNAHIQKIDIMMLTFKKLTYNAHIQKIDVWCSHSRNWHNYDAHIQKITVLITTVTTPPTIRYQATAVAEYWPHKFRCSSRRQHSEVECCRVHSLRWDQLEPSAAERKQNTINTIQTLWKKTWGNPWHVR